MYWDLQIRVLCVVTVACRRVNIVFAKTDLLICKQDPVPQCVFALIWTSPDSFVCIHELTLKAVYISIRLSPYWIHCCSRTK